MADPHPLVFIKYASHLQVSCMDHATCRIAFPETEPGSDLQTPLSPGTFPALSPASARATTSTGHLEQFSWCCPKRLKRVLHLF